VGGPGGHDEPEAKQDEHQQRNPIVAWPAHTSPPGKAKNVPAPLSNLKRRRTRGGRCRSRVRQERGAAAGVPHSWRTRLRAKASRITRYPPADFCGRIIMSHRLWGVV